MMNDYSHYIDYGTLFGYPNSRTGDLALQCLGYAKISYPEAVEPLAEFTRFVNGEKLDRLEEIYTRTFHIQAICYLDLGYVIFGEDYKRGEFLVNMKREQMEAGNDCGDELADNLCNVLSLLPKIGDIDFRDELVAKMLVPSVKKMLSEFETSRMAMKRQALQKKHKALLQEDEERMNIYQYLLQGLLVILESDFKEALDSEPEFTPQPAFGAAFLSNCGTCAIPQPTKLQNHGA
ncbi:MAG: hypothetical protein OEY51_06160 [Cyclobacteriaceae bacterium]|nr:hypothetical protein [Cyclobacteriaceae bacterium]